jgi:hypothetical protein
MGYDAIRGLEHFPEKRTPVFRKKMRQNKNLGLDGASC